MDGSPILPPPEPLAVESTAPLRTIDEWLNVPTITDNLSELTRAGKPGDSNQKRHLAARCHAIVLDIKAAWADDRRLFVKRAVFGVVLACMTAIISVLVSCASPPLLTTRFDLSPYHGTRH